jgi:hypothetical protein
VPDRHRDGVVVVAHDRTCEWTVMNVATLRGSLTAAIE